MQTTLGQLFALAVVCQPKKTKRMNFKELEQKIETATKKAFIEIFNEHKTEDIYTFSLYSDGGAITVCPSTNTIDFLENLDEEEKEELTYYKFEPAEWKYEMAGAVEEFDDICTELSTELGKNNYENEYEDEETFVAFRNRLFKLCVKVLKKLKKEDFFRNIIGKDIFLTFAVSDFEFDNDELENIIIELNDNDYKEEYLNWMKTWNE
ncbi:DUF4303 domain-containing protein [Fulvivirga sediminis]|uniref:DUF4303 domain-containing protein n=1 Tax=Fulvivirga sediminis TaxID=2803949 RepID=A0A937FC69_9BACT|nr:DUF4303 domain-containing protein [Fulvivirga sediminis]MBL3659002.1 DUF4303 domain-containing protein [Fulvivirga sediminis]